MKTIRTIVPLPPVALPTVPLPAVPLPAVRLPAVRLPAVRLPAVRLPAFCLPAFHLLAVRLLAVRLLTVAMLTMLAIALLAGCRSHMATITLINSSAEPISTIIVDYPSATFGKDKLAPHETFSSSVKVTDTGAIKVRFSDARGLPHSSTGPVLRPNAGSDIEISFTQENATAAIRP